MFEFPEDEASHENIEDKIMIGESLLLCAFYDNNKNSKKFKFPNSNFNSYPNGNSVINFSKENNNNELELSGKLDEIHLFLRGGFILPYQDINEEKYIINTEKLREEKINLIINIDNFNQSRGEIFYDNDELNTIDENKYYRVELFYSEKKLTFNTFKNNMENYDYKDHIIGKIELWRVNQIFVMNDAKEKKTKLITLNIKFNDNKREDNFEGIYYPENDKVIFDISNRNKDISIFDINEISFN